MYDFCLDSRFNFKIILVLIADFLRHIATFKVQMSVCLSVSLLINLLVLIEWFFLCFVQLSEQKSTFMFIRYVHCIWYCVAETIYGCMVALIRQVLSEELIKKKKNMKNYIYIISRSGVKNGKIVL